MSQSSSSSSSFEIRRPAAQPSSDPWRCAYSSSDGNVEADLGVDPARDVGDGDDSRAEVVQLPRGDPAHVPESLDHAALCAELPTQLRAGADDDHDDADPGCFVPEDRAADRDRLPGHDLGDRVAGLHRVRVHHPGHRLLVRRHVRRRDVLLGPDHRQEIGREAAGQPLELGLRHRARVAAHPSLGAAVRKAEKRALPRHPHRERGALAERDLEVVADPALRRPEDARVLDAVPGKDDPRPLVHPDRDADDDRALRIAQALRDLIGDVRDGNRLVELRDRHPVERRVPLERGMGKRFGRARHGAPSLPASRRYQVPGVGVEPTRPAQGHLLLRQARLTRSATPAHAV